MKSEKQITKALQKLFKLTDLLSIKICFGYEDNIYYPKNKKYELMARTLVIPFHLPSFLKHRNNSLNTFFNDVSHEIGHFLVTPPQRRNSVDYRIPTKISKKNIENSRYDIEEIKACYLAKRIRQLLLDPKIKNPKADELASNITYEVTAKCHQKIINWYETQGRNLVDNLVGLIK